MKIKNVGSLDRSLRIFLGIAFLVAGYVYDRTFLYALGVLALLTGAFSFCPLYTVLRIKTNSKTLEKSETA